MIKHEYQVGDVVRMKKGHPCGANTWQVIRVGADFRIKCLQCGRSVMLPRRRFESRVKEILESQISE
ncbi:DUF951 domain-containing protein [Clostridium sp. 'deep sea']|uniref:DUF951 domain-containing protein n=1 Tax=Clostridium sp. 'deep sea' TaxID=2779445 RepID=UPI0018968377|nr:DUF951 domain-containing protein [Clostridium sp. 'deep sea']QOR33981.1 DUF951 domain-containing protein [Clostridium sp. 'deep sea']